MNLNRSQPSPAYQNRLIPDMDVDFSEVYASKLPPLISTTIANELKLEHSVDRFQSHSPDQLRLIPPQAQIINPLELIHLLKLDLQSLQNLSVWSSPIRAMVSTAEELLKKHETLHSSITNSRRV